MSVIRPFRGLRAKPELAPQVACPPYDVLDTREARELARNNPISYLRVCKAELEFDDGTDPYSEKVYQRAAENIARFRKEGVLLRDEKPCLYLYRQTMNGKVQTGLVCLTSVEEYDAGRIKKHEHTRPVKVNDRATLNMITGTQSEPVFSTYVYDAGIDGILKSVSSTKPLIDFSDDGVRHEFWVIDNQVTINALVQGFARLPFLYIADGHHRSQAASETARRFREKNPNHNGTEVYNYFLNVVFPERELHIMPYNRVIRDLNGMTFEQILEKARPKFDIEKACSIVEPNKPHQFGLYADHTWYRLTAKPGSFEESHPTKSIDAAILGDNFIGPILDITDPRTDKRIDFVGGIRGTKELVRLVDSGDFKLAFALYPTSIDQLLKVADAGEVMPPKSTWFEPKLRSGLIANLLVD